MKRLSKYLLLLPFLTILGACQELPVSIVFTHDVQNEGFLVEVQPNPITKVYTLSDVEVNLEEALEANNVSPEEVVYVGVRRLRLSIPDSVKGGTFNPFDSVGVVAYRSGLDDIALGRRSFPDADEDLKVLYLQKETADIRDYIENGLLDLDVTARFDTSVTTPLPVSLWMELVIKAEPAE